MNKTFFKSFLASLIVTFFFALILFIIRVFIDLNSSQYFIVITLFFVFCFSSIFIYFQFINNYENNVDSLRDKEIHLLKSSAKYRREFLGNVSHELKTPIFNIQGYIETLISGAIYDKTVNKKYLKRTSKSVDRLIYIIQDLETISQLESDELSLELSNWKLKHLINEIIDQFEIKASQKNIKLIHDQKTTDFRVSADKGKIAQVLYNLISNSIKYGKQGGNTKISCHQFDNVCLVSVKDNGIGVSEKNKNRLFERFYRVDKSRSREQGGTGLGLAIVKHIIEAHQQSISVKSAIGRGTEFTFSLKCVK
tara:strand:- start:876 stop:1802 length:927 start_codon:yes stop_codon:yes gene_type:complete